MLFLKSKHQKRSMCLQMMNSFLNNLTLRFFMRSPNGDVQEVVGYMGYKLREKSLDWRCRLQSCNH